MKNLVKIIAVAILTLSSVSTFAQANKKVKILFVLIGQNPQSSNEVAHKLFDKLKK